MKRVDLDEVRQAQKSWLAPGYTLIATEDFESVIYELQLLRYLETCFREGTTPTNTLKALEKMK